MSVDPASASPAVSTTSESGDAFASAVSEAQNQDSAQLLDETLMQGVSSVGMSYMMSYINDMKKQMKPVDP